MFSALLVATLGLVGTPHRLQEPVEMLTLELRASRCSVALAEISKQTHLSLEASPQVANEIVLISVKNMPVRPLLTKLAYVVSGQWKQDGNVFRLSADNDRRRIEAIREVETKRQSVRNSLLKRAEQFAKMNKLSKDTKPAEAVEGPLDFQMSPDNMLVRILQGVNLAEASTIEEGDRLVYSTQPTRMQRPLPNGTMATVNQMVTAHNARIGETTKADVEDAMAGQAGGEMPEFMKEIMARQTRRVTGPISKANLVIQSRPLGMGITATLNVYDAKGNVALTEQTSLDGGALDFMGALAEEMEAKTDAKKPPQKETLIEFSEDSKAFAKSAQGGVMNSGNFMIKLDQKQRRRLMNPFECEPLSLAATDSFFALAKKQGKPIIASVPDSIFPSLFSGAASSSVEGFERDILKGGKANIVADPEYLLVMPSRPAENRQRRADRGALTTLLAAVESKSFPSLDDLSTYATKSAPPSSNPVTQTYLSLFAPSAVMQGFTGLTNWTMLRFYGQLPQGQRTTLLAGGRIPFNQIGPDATASLNRLVYGGGTLDVERPSAKPQSDDFFSKMMRQFGGLGGGIDFKDEPTESLPDGLPASGVIEVKSSSGPLLLPVGGDTEMATYALGAEELGLFKMMKDTPAFKEAGSASDPFKLPEQARVGTRASLNFVFRLAPGISLSESLQDLSMPKDARRVSLASLPADIQRQVDAEFEKLKKSPMAAMMAMGSMGRSAAPPPR